MVNNNMIYDIKMLLNYLNLVYHIYIYFLHTIYFINIILLLNLIKFSYIRFKCLNALTKSNLFNGFDNFICEPETKIFLVVSSSS